MIINLDFIYPVGSIYLSAKPTNPETLFGGTWIQIKGRYLYAVDATSGDKGKDSLSTYTGTGAQSHTLTVNEIPSHSHPYAMKAGTGGWTIAACADGAGVYTGYTGNSGGGKGHTHNIAYVDVYMWQRTA